MSNFDFALGEAVEIIRESAARFSQERIAPLAAELEAKDCLPRKLWPTTFGTLIANLGYYNLMHPKLMFIGDTMHATSEVTALKPSHSQPGAGVVTFTHRVINQRDKIVCQCLRMALHQDSRQGIAA